MSALSGLSRTYARVTSSSRSTILPSIHTSTSSGHAARRGEDRKWNRIRQGIVAAFTVFLCYELYSYLFSSSASFSSPSSSYSLSPSLLSSSAQIHIVSYYRPMVHADLLEQDIDVQLNNMVLNHYLQLGHVHLYVSDAVDCPSLAWNYTAPHGKHQLHCTVAPVRATQTQTEHVYLFGIVSHFSQLIQSGSGIVHSHDHVLFLLGSGNILLNTQFWSQWFNIRQHMLRVQSQQVQSSPSASSISSTTLWYSTHHSLSIESGTADRQIEQYFRQYRTVHIENMMTQSREGTNQSSASILTKIEQFQQYYSRARFDILFYPCSLHPTLWSPLIIEHNAGVDVSQWQSLFHRHQLFVRSPTQHSSSPSASPRQYPLAYYAGASGFQSWLFYTLTQHIPQCSLMDISHIVPAVRLEFDSGHGHLAFSNHNMKLSHALMSQFAMDEDEPWMPFVQQWYLNKPEYASTTQHVIQSYVDDRIPCATHCILSSSCSSFIDCLLNGAVPNNEARTAESQRHNDAAGPSPLTLYPHIHQQLLHISDSHHWLTLIPISSIDLAMYENWKCNVHFLQFQHYIILAEDQEAYSYLQSTVPTAQLYVLPNCPSRSPLSSHLSSNVLHTLHYSFAQQYQYILYQRYVFILRLLKHGIHVFVANPYDVWLSNPHPLLQHHNSTDTGAEYGYDIQAQHSYLSQMLQIFKFSGDLLGFTASRKARRFVRQVLDCHTYNLDILHNLTLYHRHPLSTTVPLMPRYLPNSPLLPPVTVDEYLPSTGVPPSYVPSCLHVTFQHFLQSYQTRLKNVKDVNVKKKGVPLRDKQGRIVPQHRKQKAAHNFTLSIHQLPSHLFPDGWMGLEDGEVQSRGVIPVILHNSHYSSTYSQDAYLDKLRYWRGAYQDAAAQQSMNQSIGSTIANSSIMPHQQVLKLKYDMLQWNLTDQHRHLTKHTLEQLTKLFQKLEQWRLIQLQPHSSMHISTSNTSLPSMASSRYSRTCALLPGWHQITSHHAESAAAHSAHPIAALLHIRIIASYHPHRLRRLFKSLQQQSMVNIPSISMEIMIDQVHDRYTAPLMRASNYTQERLRRRAEVIAISNEFVWQYGNKTVHVHESYQGHIKQWMQPWPEPNEQCTTAEPSFILLLQDDVMVSPHFFTFLFDRISAYFTPHAMPSQLVGLTLDSVHQALFYNDTSSPPFNSTLYAALQSSVSSNLTVYGYQLFSNLHTLLMPRAKYMEWLAWSTEQLIDARTCQSAVYNVPCVPTHILNVGVASHPHRYCWMWWNRWLFEQGYYIYYVHTSIIESLTQFYPSLFPLSDFRPPLSLSSSLSSNSSHSSRISSWPNLQENTGMKANTITLPAHEDINVYTYTFQSLPPPVLHPSSYLHLHLAPSVYHPTFIEPCYAQVEHGSFWQARHRERLQREWKEMLVRYHKKLSSADEREILQQRNEHMRSMTMREYRRAEEKVQQQWEMKIANIDSTP